MGQTSRIGTGDNDVEAEILSFDGGTSTGIDSRDGENSGGTSTGSSTIRTGTSRRGRPRKDETDPSNVHILEPGEVPARVKRRSKKTGIAPSDLANNISTICNFIASFNRPWWAMSAGDTLPLAEPLAEGLEQLPPELIEGVSKVSLPISIIVGAVIVFHKPLLMEYNIGKQSVSWNTKPQQSKPGTGTGTGNRSETGGVHSVDRNGNGVSPFDLPTSTD